MKMAERHLYCLYNLFQLLQNAENTQNRPKIHPKWFPIEEVMPKTSSIPFSPKNSTKSGVAGVNTSKNGKWASNKV
jgi:hypothetical protein